VVASKIDAAQEPKRIKAVEREAKKRKLPFHRISSVTGEGIEQLKHLLAERM
jgi:GTP-binding protein